MKEGRGLNLGSEDLKGASLRGSYTPLNLHIKLRLRDFPGDPVAKTALPMQGARFTAWSGN